MSAPWQKAMTNLNSALKSRDITLPTKVQLIKVMVFPVVMYRCASWTVKEAECRRIDAFELWCWRRLLRVPQTARRSNQSILKENQPWIFTGRTDAQGEASILWPPDVKSWFTGKGPDPGKDWGWDGWMASLTQWMHLSKLGDSEGKPGLLQFTGLQRVRHDLATEQQQQTKNIFKET